MSKAADKLASKICPSYFQDTVKQQLAARDIDEAVRPLVELLELFGEHCPDCPNTGTRTVRDENGDPSPEQCEFCHRYPTSAFNVEAALEPWRTR